VKHQTIVAVGCACAVAGCAATPSVGICADNSPWWRERGNAAADFCKHIPYIAGDFYRTYIPSGTRYLNDHTLIRGPRGIWHLYGITNSSAGDPDCRGGTHGDQCLITGLSKRSEWPHWTINRLQMVAPLKGMVELRFIASCCGLLFAIDPPEFIGQFAT